MGEQILELSSSKWQKKCQSSFPIDACNCTASQLLTECFKKLVIINHSQIFLFRIVLLLLRCELQVFVTYFKTGREYGF